MATNLPNTPPPFVAVDSENLVVILKPFQRSDIPKGGFDRSALLGKMRPSPPVVATISNRVISFNMAQEKFLALADDWLDSQSGKSRIDYSHPSHLQIVGMGESALPFLMREVQMRSGHWFVALSSIAGASPVPIESRASFESASNAWINWGKERGYGAMDYGKGNMDAVAPSQTSRRHNQR